MSSAVESSNLYRFSDVDVLKVGHHGSGTSSSQSFLNVVRPEVAVVSAAKGNSYGRIVLLDNSNMMYNICIIIKNSKIIKLY